MSRGVILTPFTRSNGDEEAGRPFTTTGTNTQAVVVISLSDTTLFKLPSQACYMPPPVNNTLKPRDEAKLKKAVTEYFTAPTEKQATWKFPPSLDKLLRENEPAVRHATWEAYLAAPIHNDQKNDFTAHQVRFEKYLSPYTVKTVGKRPTDGWALFIAMHGGGGAPKEVNDSQWKIMQRYYKDHPEAGGYVYVALRAPTTPGTASTMIMFIRSWTISCANFCFSAMWTRTRCSSWAIRMAVTARLPLARRSRTFSPPSMSARARRPMARRPARRCATPSSPSWWVRMTRRTAASSATANGRTPWPSLRGQRNDIYPVTVKIIPGNGHTGLTDRDKFKEMYPAVRNPVPRELTWEMTDGVIKDFFWLHTDAPAKKREIDAGCRDNTVTVTMLLKRNISDCICPDGRLVDFNKPVNLSLNVQLDANAPA